ncbi:MAG: leucyl aminopeptidase [Candidatus Uhrbacteria bacterium]|nr:leucyl aminopeptidase [Candidatus Uhrbacteria bacterium]
MAMKISARKGELTMSSCEVLVVNVFVDVKELGGATGAVNAALGGKLAKYMKEDRFKAKLGATFVLRTNGEIPARRVLVVGLGKKEEFGLESVRQAAAASMNVAKSLGAKSVVSVLHGAGNGELRPADCAQAIVEGVRLADYAFDAYRSAKKEKKQVDRFDLVTHDGQNLHQALKGIEMGELMACGTIFARDLVNTPAQDMHPEKLVEAARSIAKGNASVRVRVYERAALARMGAGGLLGVAQGSDHPPYLVHMVYKPKKATKKRIALVGKAVTFDSGGLSLKPADGMMTMKCDMAGSAAVLGAFRVMADIAPACEVHGIFGAVENMPSGKAIRPGDVLTAMNKKTIEVLNTDAEGRLTLADTLTFATKQKPQAIIDLATLTGACMVALGEEITGIMCNNDDLAGKILEASNAAGEKMWRLPLEKNYRKLLKSEIADMQNIGSRWGGALTAGLFLEEFVDKTPWAHLDIAGPAFAEREIDPYTHKGATGHGVRTLLNYLKNI